MTECKPLPAVLVLQLRHVVQARLGRPRLVLVRPGLERGRRRRAAAAAAAAAGAEVGAKLGLQLLRLRLQPGAYTRPLFSSTRALCIG